MSAFEEYLTEGRAEVTAYSGDLLVQAWPAMDLRWDASRRVFAWFWAGDEAPHAFKISKISVDDYKVTLQHDHGQIELGPIWNSSQEAILGAWERSPERDLAAAQLAQAIEEAAHFEPAPAPVLPPNRYEVMIEWCRSGDDPDLWVPVGAWAANETEIAFVALPRFAPVEAEYRTALASAESPLETFNYFWADANGYTVTRGMVDPVEATSAAEAARMAATAREDDTFRTE